MNDPNERDLVRWLVQRGDEESFRILYDRHTPRLLAIAFQLTGARDRGAAEDIVHEAWLRVVARLDSFRWESELSTWITGILINVARETSRDPFVTRATEVPIDVASEETSARVDARIDVQRALALLPEGRRTVLVLHDLHGYRHADIAALLGISEGTSKRQLHDARHQLEERFREESAAWKTMT